MTPANPLGRNPFVGTAGGARAGRPEPVDPLKPDRYQINTCEPPPKSGRGPRKDFSELVDQLKKMKPGNWLIWADAPKTCPLAKMSKHLSQLTGMKILVYRSSGKKVICQRAEECGAPGAPAHDDPID